MSGKRQKCLLKCGYQDFSSHKVSLQEQNKIMQENSILPLIYWTTILKLFKMKKALFLQKMESMFLEWILKVQDGTQQSSHLMKVSQKYFTQKYQCSGSSQVWKKISLRSRLTIVPVTKHQSDRELSPQLVTPQTMYLISEFHPIYLKITGSWEELPFSFT